MQIRIRLVLGLSVLAGALMACASIAGLDDSDPISPAMGDGGNGIGPGELKTDAGVTISPASIEFARLKCGESQSKPITITNVGTEPATYSITVAENGAFSLENADGGTVSGEVPPKDVRIVNLTAKSDAPGNESTDVIVKAGDTVQQITATLEARGAGLVLTPTTLDFGEVRQNADSPPANVIFQNTGNDPITITSFSDAGGFTMPTNLTVPGGAQVPGAFVMSAAKADDVPVSVAVTPNLDGSLCGPIPTLTLKGQRTNQAVTVGPPTLDFGRVGCGALSATKPKLTITNSALSQVHYTVTFAAGASSKFKAESPVDGFVAKPPDANHPTSVDLVFSQATPQTSLADINETITVTIEGTPALDPPVAPKTITLHEAVYGAVLQTWTTGCLGYPDLKKMADNETGCGLIRNIGNAPVCVTYAMSGGQANVFTPETNDFLDANQYGGLLVKFHSSSDGDYASSVVISHSDCAGLGGGESAPFCAPPPTVDVSGHR